MATSFLKVLNRAFSTLDGAINNSVTTVNVAAGEGANFPASFDYHVTVGSEIMKVTGRSTDALTVTRGAESSSAAAHSDGDTIYVAGGRYTGTGAAVVTVTKSIILYGGSDGWWPYNPTSCNYAEPDRHNNGANYLFPDGHVEWVSMSNWETNWNGIWGKLGGL